MSEDKLKAREKLEENFSYLIKILKEEKTKCEEEKNKYLDSIDAYNKKILDIKEEIKEIKEDKQSYIDEKSNEHLSPEKFHQIDILTKKQELYQDIFDYLKNKKNKILRDFDNHIEEFQNNIEKFKKDLEKIKKAIWKGELIEIKVNEVTDLKELKKYYRENEKILEKIKD